ncbi:MAG: NUDIX hydrolase N-terminal domain-containing protein [Gammaproteobacteria bacterium]|nr:NUDIX hydrolase N-terminal domain-containing protein [Gammaproteobacteria bacterium]
MSEQPDWLATVSRLRAIAQTGLAYSSDPYDLERFTELQQSAERMLGWLVDAEPARIAEIFLPERGYPTPKIDVRAGVFKDDTVLLVQESSDGRWSLPGGWGDEHDSPRSCVEREVLEESGFRVQVSKLVAVKDRHLHPYQPKGLHRVYKLLFLCELLGGEARTSMETTAVRFFPVTGLPALSLGRTLPADVTLLLEHRHNPGLACYVD